MVRKLFLCIVFLSIFVLEGKTQFLKCTFGIKGVGIATMMDTDPKPKGMNFGGGGGAFVGLRAGRTLGVQAEFLYAMQGAKYELDRADITLKHTYYHIPISLQLWVSRGFMFEVGFQQSILGKGTLEEQGSGKTLKIDDEGAFNYGSFLAGFSFNMGKVVYFNARYTMGMGESYVINGKTGKTNMIQAGLGFRFYTSKRSAFK